jgi:hypothetical protein
MLGIWRRLGGICCWENGGGHEEEEVQLVGKRW